jgi:glycine cleavage system H lipoate-binding protein
MMHFRDHQILAAIQEGGRSALEVKRFKGSPEIPKLISISGYQVADGYYYHAGHSWVRLERGGRIKVGVDDFISKVLGTATAFGLPARGATLRQSQPGWLWKRNGKKAEVLSPSTGRVFAVNQHAIENPGVVHDDPYGEGWLFVLEPAVLKNDLRSLISIEKSLQWIEEENQELLGLLGREYERLAATGGEPVSDLFGLFPEIGWDRLVKRFLRTGE